MRPALTRLATIAALALLVALGPATPSTADVVHSGESINTPTIWSAADNDHIVIGTVSVTQSGSLTIEEGCNVLFDANAKLEILGTLNAVGGAAGITFTRRDPGEFWQGIYYRHPSDGTLSDCTIEHVSVFGNTGDAIRVDQTAVVTIQDCTIRDNDRGIRTYQGSGPTISGCTIEANVTGIQYDQAVSPTLTSANTLLNNTTGVRFSSSTNATIDNQAIVGSGGAEGAISVENSGEFTVGSGNSITGNSWGLTIDVGSGPSIASAGNIPLAGNTNDDGIQVVSSSQVGNAIWRNLGADYIVTGNPLVNGTTLTIDQGCTIRFEAGKYLQVTGTLNAVGGVSGILFTQRDPGDAWGGIRFWTGDGTLQDCTIEHASVAGEAGVRVEYSNVTIQDCLIRNCGSGIRTIQGAEPVISGCTIENNTTGIRYDNITSPTLTLPNTIQNNGTGVAFSFCTAPTVDDQTITGSTSADGALFFENSGEFTLGSGNTVTGNTWGLSIDVGSGPSVGSMGNLPIAGNDNSDGIRVWGGSSNGYAIWRDLGESYIVVGHPTINQSGHLVAEGVDIYFGWNVPMSILGNITATDTGFRAWDDTGAFGWSGLQFWTGNGTFQSCLFWGAAQSGGGAAAVRADGGSSVELEDTWMIQGDRGVRVWNSAVSLKRCAIFGNSEYGIYLTGGGTVIFGSDLSEWNDVYGNGSGPGRDLHNGTEDIAAPYVYWGTTEEPGIESAIHHEPDSAALGLVAYAPWTNVTHTQQFGASFTDVTPPAMQTSGEASGSWGDYDGDGDHDLYVVGPGPNRLFRNDDGSFADVTPAALADTLYGLDATWMDFENDGDLDLLVANVDDKPLWARNDGGDWHVTYFPVSADFVDVEATDFEPDGDIDWLGVGVIGASSVLWRNDGDIWIGELLGGPDTPRDGAFADFDGDGDPDLAVAGHDAGAPEVTFFRNDGSTGFSTLTSYTNVGADYYATVAWTDSDGDGLQNAHAGGYNFADIVVCSDGQTPAPCTPPSLADSGLASSASWGDFDNDGLVDLYLAKQSAPNRLFQNLGSHTFTDVATGGLAASVGSSSAAWADYDGDGDLDLFLAMPGGSNRLLRNDGGGGHWLHVDLEGLVTNRFGVGTKIRVFAGGTEFLHEVGTGSGHGAQNSLTAEFGLGSTTVVDSVVVSWIAGEETYGPFSADQRVTLTEPIVFVHDQYPDLGDGQTRGTSWGDYDGDGDEDLFLARWGDHDVLLQNDQGVLNWTPSVLASPDSTHGGAWGDYNNDGLLDLLVTSATEGGRPWLYRNEGGGAFTKLTTTISNMTAPSQMPYWVDYDVDGDLDAYICADSNPFRLFRNDGGDVFVDATTGPLFDFYDERHAAWGDYDDDGDPDLFSSRSDGPAALLRNDSGTFVDVSAELPVVATSFAYGGEWTDYDDDGDLDLYLAKDSGGGSTLFRNDGPSGFSDATPAGLDEPFLTSSWQDYDNDGDLDLYGSYGVLPPKLLRNDAGSFVDVAGNEIFPLAQIFSFGAAWADYDENGSIDYVETGVTTRTYRNSARLGNHWLRVHLEGTVSNRSAIGARVTAVTGSQRQLRERTVHGDYRGQNSLVVHFGLGQAATVDSLIVRWPAGGVQVMTDVAANSEMTIIEGGTTAVEIAARPIEFSVGQSFPNPFRSSAQIAFGLPEPSHVNLKIFDVSGRLVRTLSNEARPAGRHTVRWDGRDSGGRNVATGIYFYRFEAGDFRESKRLVRMR